MPSEVMGARLKELREKAGMSQSQLAEAAGVPISTIRGWEYGRREPLLSAGGKLAKALGVAMEALLEPPTVAPERPPGRPKKVKQEEEEVPGKKGKR